MAAFIYQHRQSSDPFLTLSFGLSTPNSYQEDVSWPEPLWQSRKGILNLHAKPFIIQNSSVPFWSSHWTLPRIMCFTVLLSAMNATQSPNDLHQQSSLEMLINPQNLLQKYHRNCATCKQIQSFQRLHTELVADLGYSLRNSWTPTVWSYGR